MTSDDHLRDEIERRKAVVQGCIRKLESSMATHEDHLEHLRMWEPDTKVGEDDLEEEDDPDVVVKASEEDDLIGEPPGGQGAERPMEVNEPNPTPTTQDDKIEITPWEDALLMGEQPPQGDTVSVAGDLANLNIASHTGNDTEGSETS